MTTRRLARLLGLTFPTRALRHAPLRPRRQPQSQRPAADDAQRPSLEAELARLDGRAV